MRKKQSFKKVEINSVSDVYKAVAPFLKIGANSSVNISSNVEWEEDGKKTKATVSSISHDANMRDMLIEGFDQVKEHNKMWSTLQDHLEEDGFGVTLPIVNSDSFHLPVDRLISQRLGGKREGMLVVWDFSDVKIEFDPYESEVREIEKSNG